MPAFTTPAQLSFTPSEAGELSLTCTLSAESSSSVFSAAGVRCFIEQGGVFTFGPTTRIAGARTPHTVMQVLPIVAGPQVTCGLQAVIDGAATVTLHDMRVRAEFIKR